MNNLHISLTTFKNESRVIKEIMSLKQAQLFEKIFIAALHSPNVTQQEELSSNILLTRFSLKSKRLGKNLFTQLIKYIEFSKKIYIYYKNKNISVINIHSLALLPIGVFLKKAYKAKLVYDTHELETEKNGLSGLRKFISKQLEKKLIKYVDLTIVVSENIADWYMDEYNISRPTVVFNVPLKRQLQDKNLFREQLPIKNNQKILLYQGGLTKGRGVQLLLEAFKQRIDEQIVVVFMGYGELENDIKLTSHEYNNIFFYPAVGPETVLEYTASADIGISLIENTCLSYYYCMPNKLFEYIMAGLPIIVSNMQDMSEFVSKNHLGSVITNFSIKNINLTIDHLLSQDLDMIKINAYNVACHHSWEAQENKMLLAYKKILKSKE